ncbi:MAG: hypothetical protein ABH848_05785 [Candidatus Omnitrophota bacterium]
MRRLTWLFLILIVACCLVSCSRTKRIANDVDWIVFDGEPNRQN